MWRIGTLWLVAGCYLSHERADLDSVDAAVDALIGDTPDTLEDAAEDPLEDAGEDAGEDAVGDARVDAGGCRSNDECEDT